MGGLVIYLREMIHNSDQSAYFEEISKTTYVPLRAVVEALNNKVSWDNDSQVITLEKNGKIIELKIGSNKVFVDGKETVISAPVKLAKENSRSLVPLSFFQMYYNLK